MTIRTIEELKAEFATGQYPNASDYSDLIDTLNSGSGGGGVESSPTPPENPESGDLWFNEVDGSSYIYYVDEDSEQWIEIGGTVGASGSQGPQGNTGATGAQGEKGDTGEGVAAGGTTGQVLIKSSNTNYETSWSTNSLNNLSNVSLSSPSSGDILEYNGTNWVKGQRATTGKAIAMSIVFG
jgi:hypothetical protein